MLLGFYQKASGGGRSMGGLQEASWLSVATLLEDPIRRAFGAPPYIDPPQRASCALDSQESAPPRRATTVAGILRICASSGFFEMRRSVLAWILARLCAIPSD